VVYFAVARQLTELHHTNHTVFTRAGTDHRTAGVTYSHQYSHRAFSALTLLTGLQEEHPASRNWVMKCWCGYLSGARCRSFAYGLADATAIPKPHYLLPPLNPDRVLPFWYQQAQVVLEKRPLNGYSSSIYILPHYRNRFSYFHFQLKKKEHILLRLWILTKDWDCGIGQIAVMPYSWESNRRSDIVLTLRHGL